MSAPENYLNVTQAAEYLACGKRRIYDLVYLGKLNPKREGKRLLFTVSDLQRLVR